MNCHTLFYKITFGLLPMGYPSKEINTRILIPSKGGEGIHGKELFLQFANLVVD